MKRIIALLLCLMLLPAALNVEAANVSAFLHFQDISESSLTIYGKALPEDGKLTVSVDSQKITDSKFSVVAKKELPTTVYCLVDTSLSMSNAQVQQEMDVLKTLSKQMGEDDSMVIATLGSELKESELLTDRDARNDAIADIQREGYSTNLFEAVVSALKSLQTKTAYETNRCLLILSDGINDGKSSTSEAQVMDAIHESPIPVYSIAVVDPYPSAYALDKTGAMTRFAEESVGGIGLVPSAMQLSASDAAEQIWSAVQMGCVITVNLKQVESRSNSANVHVVYETDEERFDDSITVDLSSVNKKGVQEEPKEEDEEAEDEEFPILPVAGGAAAVLVVIALLVSANKKKKARNAYRPAPAPAPAPAPKPEPKPAAKEMPKTEAFIPVNVGKTEPVGGSSSVAADFFGAQTPKVDVNVQLVAIMHPEITCSFGLNTHASKTLGRDRRADILLNGSDSELSGRHCAMEWDGSKLYLQDVGSTNGTSVNGVPLKPNAWYPLENGTSVRMGSCEYRITIQA